MPVSENSLRIMTYNIHHGVGRDGGTPHLQRLAHLILAEDPHIVALQEVDRFWARSADADQPKELGTLLDMGYCFGANLALSADSHADIFHEYGVATFSRYPFTGCKNHALPSTDGWEQRGMLDTRIDIPSIGEVAVLNTHLQANVDDKFEEASRLRYRQSRTIKDHIATLDVPVLLLGDFNTEPECGEIDSLIGAGSDLIDVWAIAGDGVGETISDGAHGELNARIDYILVSPHFDVLTTFVVNNEESRMASDHFPLIAALGFSVTTTSAETLILGS